MFNNFFNKIPLAWLQLKYEKLRFLVAIAGIAFADILMFFQLGILDALFDGSSRSHQMLKADLVLVSSQFQTLFTVTQFPRERLFQTLAYDSVESVSSIYISVAQWRNPETHIDRSILVWGIDPVDSPFNLTEISQHQTELKFLNRVLFDQGSRPEYGAIANLLKQQKNLEIQINNKTVIVSGLFTIGASLITDGNVITSDSTFLNLFPNHQREHISMGLIKVKSGTDPQQFQKQLTANLPNDVRVFTPSQLAENEVTYWSSQGVGFIFGLGVIVGFIVGIVIVYQILYSDVSEHIPEYATLKAIGYSDRYLFGVLIQSALLLAIFGYIPGFFLSVGLYQIGYNATQLPLMMKTGRAIMVLILTIIMCIVSGIIAMNKLRSADPADIF